MQHYNLFFNEFLFIINLFYYFFYFRSSAQSEVLLALEDCIVEPSFKDLVRAILRRLYVVLTSHNGRQDLIRGLTWVLSF